MWYNCGFICDEAEVSCSNESYLEVCFQNDFSNTQQVEV